jgi:UDP-N-acetylmuramoyl-tripeptide--D-alanyl-D-alanine ligase
VQARDVTLDAAGHASFTLRTPAADAPVRLRLLGEHQVANALAAACAATAVGVSADRIGAALSSAVPRSQGRFQITERPDGVTIIDDAFNANPVSTRAALRTLGAMAAGRRMIAVLGEMKHLADETIHHHTAIGALAGEVGVAVVVAASAASMSPGCAAIACPSSAPSNIARFAPSPAGGIRCAASPRRVTPGARSHRCPSGSV